MEIRQLRYFCKVCEAGSLTAAARELFVTEQTVSNALIRLEKELGCTLLERGRHGATPTDEGARLLMHALRIVHEADAAVADLRGEMAGRQSTIVLAAVVDAIVEGDGGVSTAPLRSFERANPGVKVRLIESQRAHCLKTVQNRSADLAFVTGGVEGSNLEGHLVCMGRMVLAFSARHPLVEKYELSFADLRDEVLLTPPDEGWSLAAILRGCRAYGFEPQVKTVANRFYFDSAEAGEGFACVPQGHPKLAGKPGLAARPLIARDDVPVPLWLAVRSDDRRPLVRHLVALLLDVWGKERPEDAADAEDNRCT